MSWMQVLYEQNSIYAAIIFWIVSNLSVFTCKEENSLGKEKEKKEKRKGQFYYKIASLLLPHTTFPLSVTRPSSLTFT